METGLCPLCQKPKAIVDSHLIPKAVYPYCRDAEGNTIVINPNFLGFSDRQLHTPLLCTDCEDILNKGGEAWLMPLLAEYDEKFPLHEMLIRYPPDIIESDAACYAGARNADIQCEKLSHFAMGIFWKASVHSWRQATTEPIIDLGSYGESVRTFLLGESLFPSEMVLTVGVLPAPTKLTIFQLPERDGESRWHNFSFYIPGIKFVLAVGGSARAELNESCFVHNQGHPILLMNFSGPMHQRLREELTSPRNIHKFERLGKRIKRPPEQ
jgi:hypothetical protein